MGRLLFTRNWNCYVPKRGDFMLMRSDAVIVNVRNVFMTKIII